MTRTRTTKAATRQRVNRIDGKTLSARWNVSAKHSLYREDGTWYHLLRVFPAAYFDSGGYLRFETHEDYKRVVGSHLSKNPEKNWATFPDGIALIEGYVAVGTRAATATDNGPRPDRDLSTNAPTHDEADDEILAGFEGERRRRFVTTRQRERWLRDEKIKRVTASGDGRLRCEVPGCGFDFEAVFGPLGKAFANVHHVDALAARDERSPTTLTELVIVCANCHAMIHVGGECRTLEDIAARRLDASRSAPRQPTD